MRVTIFAADLSSNAMGRVFVLARVLARRHDVEVVGAMFGDRVWEPIADEDLDIRSVRVSESPRSIPRLRRIAEVATGDVYLACKPVWTSYGSALAARRRTGAPIVLDVDDWEWGFSRHAIASAPNRLRYLAAAALHPHLPNAWPSAWYFDRRTHRADAVIVSNTRLRERYGGAVVWHGRDTDAFDPARFPRDDMRARLGWREDERVVLFLGTIQPYKGVDDLIAAVARLRRDDVRLALVGAGRSQSAHEAAARAQSVLGERASVYGAQPFERVPEFIAAADVVVVPQRDSAATHAQMPAKLFDAMAMARPIVATRVSDIPYALDGCGWVVEPGSPERLAAAIAEALEDSGRAGAFALEARRRAIAEFSWDAMEHTLSGVLAGVTGKAAR